MEKGEAIKAKGEELIENFLDYVKSERPPKPNGYYNARQCAIIAVEEIIKLSLRYVTTDGAGENNEINSHEFWEEVLNYLKSKL